MAADPFPGALDPKVREQIIRLSSDFNLPVGEPPVVGGEPPKFIPVPIRAHKLELTCLGANADLDGQWEYPEPKVNSVAGYVQLDLRKYQHVAALGRDHFVRTVTVGFLCGTGHRAIYIRTLERLPAGIEVVGEAPGGGARFGGKAYLLRTAQVVVQQPFLDYTLLEGAFAHRGDELPLHSIRLTTLSARVADNNPSDVFWLMRPEGGYVQFGATATDVEGGPLAFTLPLMFVPFSALSSYELIRHVFDSRPIPDVDPTVIGLGGQSMAVAPAMDQAGSTTVTAQDLRYDIEQPNWGIVSEHMMNAAAAPAWYLPTFLPRMASVTASIPVVDNLLGTMTPQPLLSVDKYLDGGFDPNVNPAGLFLRFKNPLPLGFSPQRGGGLASPSQTVEAISRGLGPVASADKLQSSTVDLGAFDAMTLFGTIKLSKVLQEHLPLNSAAAPPPTDADLENPTYRITPPRLTTIRTPPGATVPDRVESRFLWKPQLKNETIGPLTLEFGQADLLLEARTEIRRGGQASGVVRGRLRGATLTFASAMGVTIGELAFRQESGRKTEFGAKDVKITFKGPLEFINTLQSILPANGFDDPPYVTVDGQGVVAGYTLGFPTVAVGVFSLQNIGLSAALSLPFTDRPAGVRFAVSERHKPFLVTVGPFGGGGFLTVGVSANGIEEVEASIEFGANIALNLGVASGGVSVMAGIYFGLKGPVVTLTGYLRCGGYLEILGLISLSLEFYLAFTYRKKAAGSEVWGQASLSVSVKIAFFSTSVSLSVERRFAGAGGDPSFTDTMTPADWAGYLQAFA